MNLQALLVFLVIGAIAGWIAGLLMKGRGFGFAGNVVIGIIGAIIGGFLFGLLGIHVGGFLGAIAMATIGAVLLLWLIGLMKKG
ncbi:MAG: transglycosylase [Acidithiobacillales bacterium SM23_46]|jgi:uncharacterized membrane protein YeaQ/YmgE (transglycosylase-associated protein family)|nr:MAG: transglycosylase [Acidithiobacillales bacterium SM23_46]KPL27994.1 MAG: transglycosylase [Acidithiobacillales bacterium SM1_46]